MKVMIKLNNKIINLFGILLKMPIGFFTTVILCESLYNKKFLLIIPKLKSCPFSIFSGNSINWLETS